MIGSFLEEHVLPVNDKISFFFTVILNLIFFYKISNSTIRFLYLSNWIHS